MFYFFHKKTEVTKQQCSPLSKNYFPSTEILHFLAGEVSGVFHITAIPMASFGVKKLSKKTCHLKGICIS